MELSPLAGRVLSINKKTKEMKTMKIIMVALLTIALTATSCKKDETKPQAQTAAPAVTYGTYTFDIGAADLQSTTATFSGVVMAKTQCGGTILDSAQVLMTLLNPSITLGNYDPCSTTTTAYATPTETKSLKVQNGATNYLEVYDDTGLLARYEILSNGFLTVIFKSPGTNTYGKLPCGIIVPYR